MDVCVASLRNIAVDRLAGYDVRFVVACRTDAAIGLVIDACAVIHGVKYLVLADLGPVRLLYLAVVSKRLDALVVDWPA